MEAAVKPASEGGRGVPKCRLSVLVQMGLRKSLYQGLQGYSFQPCSPILAVFLLSKPDLGPCWLQDKEGVHASFEDELPIRSKSVEIAGPAMS